MAASSPPAPPSPSYAAVLRLTGVGRIVLSLVLARTAQRMLSVALVLFVLQAFDSAPLAGLTVLVSILPGIVVSPLAGALLDRRSRGPLVVTDYVVAAIALVALVALHQRGLLSPALLLAIAGASSLTNPLSSTGLRSALPAMVPHRLWDRVNGLDSASGELSGVLGPAIAGLVAAAAGPGAALLVTAVFFALAASTLIRVPGMPVPALRQRSSVWHEAALGIAYVARHRTLRGLAVGISVSNLGAGAVVVMLPLAVLHHLHAGDSAVGWMWALQGGCALISGLTVGWLGSVGRELRLILIGMVMSAAAVLLVGLATWPGVVLGIALYGAAGGAWDVGNFGLRQRRTDPAWFGRAFAVSMSANYAGYPIGSAIAGVTVGLSLLGAGIIGAVLAVAGGVFVLAMVPPVTDAERLVHAPAPAT